MGHVLIPIVLEVDLRGSISLALFSCACIGFLLGGWGRSRGFSLGGLRWSEHRWVLGRSRIQVSSLVDVAI